MDSFPNHIDDDQESGPLMNPPPPPSPILDMTPSRREKRKKKKRRNANDASDRRTPKRRRTSEVPLAFAFRMLHDCFEHIDHARRNQERPDATEADSPALPSDDFIIRGVLLG